MSFLFGNKSPPRQTTELTCKPYNPICIGEVRGQELAKQAMLIAASGRHNLLFIGPPGEGKSMIVGTMKGFLPPMSNLDKVEVYNIYRDVGMTMYCERPFREVGPTITDSTLIGGGQTVTPGEISLAHTGILFMDELPQFTSKLIDKMRNPLESREVTITRKGTSKTYPCNFQLIATMNPCLCGMYGYGLCKCTANRVRQYQARISGPIADRIDMTISMERQTAKEKFKSKTIGQSSHYAKLVQTAYTRQMRRQGFFNADIPGHSLFDPDGLFRFDVKSYQTLQTIMERRNFSTRKAIRLSRVARTLADLNGLEQINNEVITQSLKYVDSTIQALK